jgi:hypothetical protein
MLAVHVYSIIFFVRIGQSASTVRIVYALARDTADDIVWQQIQKKLEVVGTTVGMLSNEKCAQNNKTSQDHLEAILEWR